MKPVLGVTVIFLGVVALGHLARMLLGVEVVTAGWKLPVWTSARLPIQGGLPVLLGGEGRKA